MYSLVCSYMKNYKLVIFDLDGTVLDTLDDLTDSINHVLDVYHMPSRSREEIRSFAGGGIRNLIIRSAVPETDDTIIDEMFSLYAPYYKAHCLDKTCPYDGIPALLSLLKNNGVHVALVSNKSDAVVQKLIGDTFPGMFDFVVGERVGIRRKPAPDSVFEVMECLGADKNQTVYIGDSEVDVLTGQNADVDCIAVTWGFRSKDHLIASGACVLADTVEELQELLLHNK